MSFISNLSSSVVTADGFDQEEEEEEASYNEEAVYDDGTLDVSEVAGEVEEVWERLRVKEEELEEAYNEIDFLRFAVRKPEVRSTGVQAEEPHQPITSTATCSAQTHSVLMLPSCTQTYLTAGVNAETQTSLMWDVDMNAAKKKVTESNEAILDMQWKLESLSAEVESLRTAPSVLKELRSLRIREEGYSLEIKNLKTEILLEKEKTREVDGKAAWAMELADRVRNYCELDGGLESVAGQLVKAVEGCRGVEWLLEEVRDLMCFVKLSFNEGCDITLDETDPGATEPLPGWTDFTHLIRSLSTTPPSRDLWTASALLRRGIKRLPPTTPPDTLHIFDAAASKLNPPTPLRPLTPNTASPRTSRKPVLTNTRAYRGVGLE